MNISPPLGIHWWKGKDNLGTYSHLEMGGLRIHNNGEIPLGRCGEGASEDGECS